MWDVGLLLQLLIYGLLSAAVVLMVAGARSGRQRAVLPLVAALSLGSVLGVAGWFVGVGGHARSRAMLLAAVPSRAVESSGYVSSTTCRACHPGEYASWHDSYHRTMTQEASPETIIGAMDGARLAARGRMANFERRGSEYWVQLVDPTWEHRYVDEGMLPDTASDPPLVTKRVVMTTGSHNQQTYWVADDEDGKLYNVPFVWLTEDERWVPRADVFLRPEGFGPTYATWHDNCIECHATAGENEHDPATGAYQPRAAELGIACEACHGPADEHLRVNHDPLRRYRLRRTGAADPTIVNPARLSPARSAQICGQCHAINVFKSEAYRAGRRYHPGGELAETRMLLRNSDRRMPEWERDDWPRLRRHIDNQTPTFIEERLWPDGMVRVSGREYNALTESACFHGGDLSCLSCHSMHTGPRVDQLTPGLEGDQACVQCHADTLAQGIPAHTHHAAGSTGSACLNCHMPHTVYGLLKAIRSHLIDSPSVATYLATGRPDACTLCHLDRPLGWTADHLRDWYGQARPALDEEQESLSAAVLLALRGDANQRALVAWHMGWTPAREAAGTDWMAPFLGHLLADPYSAVRYIAEHALRRDPLYRSFACDFVGPASERSDARRRAIEAWLRSAPGMAARPAVLIGRGGRLDVRTLTRLSRERNDRLVDLRE